MKNKFLRVAAAMAVCALISVCAVSGTYAKYVSSSTGSDSARVAKWGFGESTSVTVDLFSNVYKNGSEEETVKSADNAKVIAPGTEYSSMVVLKNVEKSEVAYTLAVTASTDSDTTDFDNNENFVWTLKKGDAETATEYATFADLVAEINQSTDYDPNAAVPVIAMTIGWKWTYSTDETGDRDDTALGIKAEPNTISVKITVTATQKD